MRTAYFEPYSGVTGAMVLGALVDAGVEVQDLRRSLSGLNLAGYALRAERVEQHGVAGTRVAIDSDPSVGQPRRAWTDIRALLVDSSLDGPSRERALAIFGALARAEARVRQVDVETVRFDRIDTIVEVVAAAAGIGLLGVSAVYCGPFNEGHGFVRGADGVLPVPEPVTLALITTANAPLRHLEVADSLVSPAGAAILTQTARFDRPAMRPQAIGYGFGRQELPWPHALRLWVGEGVEAADAQPGLADGAGDLLLETTIDDMDPRFFAPLVDRLVAAGALDVHLTPAVAGGGRQATTVALTCAAGLREEFERILIEHSTALSVRAIPIDRTTAGRRTETVVTRWGDVRVRLKIWHGRVLDAAPDYADCLAIAERMEQPIRLIHGEATRIAEAFVGRRMEAD